MIPSLLKDDHTAINTLIAQLVATELARATARHRTLASTHEAHSVILEEFDEWWDEVKSNNRTDGVLELIQIAAMCHRALRDVYGDQLLGWAETVFLERERQDIAAGWAPTRVGEGGATDGR